MTILDSQKQHLELGDLVEVVTSKKKKYTGTVNKIKCTMSTPCMAIIRTGLYTSRAIRRNVMISPHEYSFVGITKIRV